MKAFELILRGGTVVTHERAQVADVGIADGKIAEVQPDLPGAARAEIPAAGLHIFPGIIDAHVHFNEPGRADWEGIETGSRALAAGGGTLFFDMPLNAHPPTIDAGSFDLKLAAAREKSLADFAFWGGLVPGNLDDLEPLAGRGVVGFKAFMANSGIADFPRVDDDTLLAGMHVAANLGRLVAVHAESEAVTSDLAAEAVAQGRTSVRDYLNSRPVRAELEAIQRAIEMAKAARCALHIVHVSSGDGVLLVADARAQGVDVTCETCPHYLVLTDDDMEKLGAIAKCAPPLRAGRVQEELWRHVAGLVTNIGSDHSPSPPEMKMDSNFFKVWGGISGVQHTLPLLITEGHVKRGMALPVIAKLTSFNVAERFKLPAKGRVAAGADADFALVDLRQSFELRKEDLLDRHRQSPYVGRRFHGRVTHTLVRGRVVFQDGKIIAKPRGCLVKPLS